MYNDFLNNISKIHDKCMVNYNYYIWLKSSHEY